jgi:L-amino acid N-acyltransferase YncA
MTMAVNVEIGGRFPKSIALPEARPWSLRPINPEAFKGQEVVLRLMRAEDQDRLLQFARNLPEDDLLFLRMDITDPAVVSDWARNVVEGRTVTVLAELKDTVIGYASVHMDPVRWTRRIGEIRINLAPSYRSYGIRRQLSNEIVSAAQTLELRTLVAQMTTDQKNARAIFDTSGFALRVFLAKWVADQSGQFHDVLLMAYRFPTPEHGNLEHGGSRPSN